MTRPPVREPWDDDRIDRTLRDALAVEPSARLRARVRARIAEEPARSSRPFGLWTSMAACAVAAAVVAGWLAGQRAKDPVTPPLTAGAWQPAAVAAFPHAPAVVPAAIVPIAEPLAARARVHFPPDRTVATVAGVGSVRVAPGDRAAFDLFLRYSRSGRLPTLESLPPVSHERDTLPAIEIPVIDIPALVVSSVGEGVSK